MGITTTKRGTLLVRAHYMLQVVLLCLSCGFTYNNEANESIFYERLRVGFVRYCTSKEMVALKS